MPRLLVIDDDASLLKALDIGLRARGYDIVTASTSEAGLSQAALSQPDVIVLDLGLPDGDGMVLCQRIREWSDVPIIVLSAHGTDERKVEALDRGADDFVTKPFSMAELEARLRVALRHRRQAMGEPEDPVIVIGNLTVDLAQRSVSVDGQILELTPREFDFLTFLAKHVGRVLTHRTILEEVWGMGYGDEVQYLRVYASRLRRKLGDDRCSVIRTLPGVGYQLVAQD